MLLAQEFLKGLRKPQKFPRVGRCCSVVAFGGLLCVAICSRQRDDGYDSCHYTSLRASVP
eukprot:4495674-Amphidinium_carterae.1